MNKKDRPKGKKDEMKLNLLDYIGFISLE